MIEIDYEKDPKPATGGEKVFMAIFGGTLLAGFVAEVVTSYEPIKLAGLFFVVGWVPLLFLHELGHAVVARLVGWRVEKFVIGYGKVLRQFEFAGMKCEFRMIPLSGYIIPYPTTLAGARWKNGLIYFAGPGIELLLFLGIWIVVGVGHFMEPSTNYFIIMLKGVGLAAVFGAVTNLFPMTARTASGKVANDGLGILLCCITPREEYERMLERGIREREWQNSK